MQNYTTKTSKLLDFFIPPGQSRASHCNERYYIPFLNLYFKKKSITFQCKYKKYPKFLQASSCFPIFIISDLCDSRKTYRNTAGCMTIRSRKLCSCNEQLISSRNATNLKCSEEAISATNQISSSAETKAE